MILSTIYCILTIIFPFRISYIKMFVTVLFSLSRFPSGESIFQKIYGDQARFYEGEKLPIMKHTQLGTVSMVSCGNHL